MWMLMFMLLFSCCNSFFKAIKKSFPSKYAYFGCDGSKQSIGGNFVVAVTGELKHKAQKGRSVVFLEFFCTFSEEPVSLLDFRIKVGFALKCILVHLITSRQKKRICR
jgi:hypothetical protein